MVRVRGTIDPYGAVRPSGTELATGEVLRRKADGNAVEGYVPANEAQTVKYLEYELWICPGASNIHGDTGSTEIDEYGEDATHPRAWAVSRLGSTLGLSAVTEDFYRLPTVGGSEVAGELMPLREPMQDGRSGGTSPKLAFARRRLEMFPGIKGLAILPGAIGESGFNQAAGGSDLWIAGNAPYDDMLADAQTFLANYPQYRLAGMLTDLLASEDSGTTEATMETSLQTMIAGFRNGLRGGSTAVAVLGEIPQSLQTGVGALAAQAQIDVAAADSRVGVCFTGDISLADSVHYDPAGAREFGRRMAEVAAEVADFGPVRGSQPYRMKYDATKGRFADAFGSDARIFDEVTVDSVTLPDSTTGTVLHIDREGVDTSMVFPGGDEYTIACWCQRKVSPTGNNPNAGGGSGDDTEDFFVAGRLDGQSIGNIFSRRFGAHVETGTASPTNVDLGNSGTVGSTAANAVLAVDAWFHVAITFSGGQFQKYVNGATAGSAAGSSYPDSTGPHFVQIGAWGDLTGVNGIPDMYFHDIVILPYALSAAQIATLDSDGVLPS